MLRYSLERERERYGMLRYILERERWPALCMSHPLHQSCLSRYILSIEGGQCSVFCHESHFICRPKTIDMKLVIWNVLSLCTEMRMVLPAWTSIVGFTVTMEQP